MTVTEFLELFQLLPVEGAPRASREAAIEAIINWGAEDPERWDWSPARMYLCQAKSFTGVFLEQCEPN
jgi:hypothetical protein